MKTVVKWFRGAVAVSLILSVGVVAGLALTSESGCLYDDMVKWYQSK